MTKREERIVIAVLERERSLEAHAESSDSATEREYRRGRVTDTEGRFGRVIK